MSGLVVGAVNLEVISFKELEPRRKGEITSSFNNGLRSSVSSEKRQFQAVTLPVGKVTHNALKAAIANGVVVVVSGSALLGASINAIVTCSTDLVGIGELSDGEAFQYSLSLNIQQV